MSNLLAKFVVVQNGVTVQKFSFPLNSEELRVKIGRDERIKIQDNTISKTHAELVKSSDNRLFIIDLKSTNGTFLQGRQLEPNRMYPIQIGDIVFFGKNSVVEIHIVHAEQEVPVAHNLRQHSLQQSEGATIFEMISQKGLVVIGRNSTENKVDIDLTPDKKVSHQHAIIKRLSDGTFCLFDYSRNGTYVNDKLVNKSSKITTADNIRIGSYKFALNSRINAPVGSSNRTMLGELASQVESINISNLLKSKSSIVIGRETSCDVPLKSRQVSRQHVEVTKESDGVFVRDLDSTNGTFLNGRNIKGKGKVIFRESDELIVDLFAFRLNESVRELSLETAIRAVNIEKQYPGYMGLKKMSVSIPNKSFIALMGPSGCGKTTLLNALNGDNPATSGRVYIHGLELSKNYNILKRRIGYVPQSDIVHMELTVEESLFYAAKLRMPDDTTDSDITERITEVLNNLKINDKHIRENKVSKLSGGQRKRVSIAVELLNNPTILFLDEPTSPLDPETIEEFLICLKELTEQGTTVVMVTHKPSDLEFVDRVIFMATKGYHCFYGDKADIESHFGAKNLIQVYSMLSIDERKNETEDKVELWYNKWYTKQKPQQTTEDSNEIKKDAPQSMSRQFYWLAKRYLNIKLNDRQNLFLLLAQPIIIGGLLAMIFQKLQLGVLFMMAISAIWFGVSNAAKEIVGELPIYRRERMFNLNIITYLMSKITILALIAFVQVLIFVLIVYARYVSDEIGVVYFWKYVAFMFYLAVSATLVGLQLSSLFKTTEQVMTVVPMALMPQIILAGVITRIDESWKELLSYLTLGRWGTEGFARIQDSDPKFKQIDTILSNPVKDTIYGETYNIPGQDPIKMVKDIKFVYEHTDTTTIRSVYTTTPDLIKDKFIVDAQATEASLDTIGVSSGELIYQKTSALSQLDFYNDKLMGIFNSFEQNLLIITIINIVVFAGLFVAMKKKDNL